MVTIKSRKARWVWLAVGFFILAGAGAIIGIFLSNSVEAEPQYLSTAPVVTDALGRALPTYEEVGPRREDKSVGVFYFLWQGYHGNQVNVIPDIIAANPEDPEWGPVNSFHFWGEPEAGFYRSEDPWVIRRYIQMLTAADVDWIFFDTTNGPTYLKSVMALGEVSMQMRSEGHKTPEIAFLTNTASGRVMTEIYEAFYKEGHYEELWFHWDGKPLIMGHENDPDLSAEARDFFTIKFSWAHTNTQNEPNHWPWLMPHPQAWGWSTIRSEAEQISVSSAHHPANPHGQSYTNRKQPAVDENYLSEFTGQGLQLIEQWERALFVDPKVVMVTQWNEWIAQRFVWNRGSGSYAGRPIENGDSWFVDVFNQEFNRDIAPMKGGHTDNLYYVLMSYIRQYKGMDEPELVRANVGVKIDGDFKVWEEVTPVYRDPIGDTMHRDFAGYDPETQYTNDTGRNDIIESRIAYDRRNIFFHVKTAEDLTPHTDLNWMHLYLDIDRSKNTGWEGYDFAVNIQVNSETETILSEFKDGQWHELAKVDYHYNGNEMEIAIPRDLIGQDEAISFEFKWADHVQELYEIEEFFLSGDTAPDRRGNYLFYVE